MISACNTTGLQQKSDRTSNPTHIKEWVEGSAVDKAIATLAIESLTAEELNERIKPKTPIQTGGWWCRGVNWRTGEPMGNRYGQGKPDKPHLVSEGKEAKYLTASGTPVDAVFLDMPNDKDYWFKIYNDKKATRYWTEGFKKAGAGLSLGLPTIAVTGVWNWIENGGLAKDVELWAEPKTTHTICFDSDYQDKPQCREAIKRLADLLQKKGCIVKIASWSRQWKGMDDFIVANGGDAFKEVVAGAKTIDQWEKQFNKPERHQKVRPPAASQLARLIADKYREKLAWDIKVREWRSYGLTQDGVWEIEPKEAIEQVVRVELDAQLPDGYSHRQLSDIMNLLKSDLLVKKWNQAKGYIPLQNGVLSKKTKQLSPHSPGFRLTHCLPFAYDPEATCEPITNWLGETTGHKEDLVQFLLAYLNAVVNQRSDLQRYLELIGPGGTGKSTYMKLASYLVGDRNVHTTKHQILEESRFETANLADKLLCLITEADQYVGSVNVLKAITGQDPLHYEQKMKQAGEGFIYQGMVITAGNEPSRSTDYTSGLARRKIPVWFRNFIPGHKRRDLDSEFKKYLPGLLNLVLTFSDDEVTDLIRNAEQRCPSIYEYQRETLTETNPIADWLDNKVLRAHGSRHNPEFLYNAYKSYSESQGQKPISQKRFSNLLIDLCQVQLGWSDVTRGRDRRGRFILGLALRLDGDFSPFPITEALSVTDEPVTVTDSVTAETTAVYGCDGCDAFSENKSRIEKTADDEAGKKSCVNELKNDPQPVTRHQPVTLDTEENEICEGDQVNYIGERSKERTKKFGGGRVLVVTSVSRSIHGTWSDTLTCQSPDGLSENFSRHSLKLVGRKS